MGQDLVRGRSRRVAVAVLSSAIVVAVASVSDAHAHTPRLGPMVILGSAATLTPDGQAATIEVIARCPERWTVLEASVTIS